MNPNDALVQRLKSQAVTWERGNRYEDFFVDQHFTHHWGRTLTVADNTLFSVLTLHYGPAYVNAPFAQAHGHPTTPVNPLLVFNTVFGLSVEDLSEMGGPFLGVENLVFGATVYPDDTLSAGSTVVAMRLASNRPGFGIVTWHTRGVNQRDEEVIRFKRSNLVRSKA